VRRVRNDIPMPPATKSRSHVDAWLGAIEMFDSHSPVAAGSRRSALAESAAQCRPSLNKRCRSSHNKRRGFSLIELLVVIGIIGVLIALLLPAVQAAREAARRTGCSANMRQMGIAVLIYHDVHAHLPPGSSAQRQRRIAWSAVVLPYIEQPHVWSQLDVNQPYNSSGNQAAASTVLSVYLCPSTARHDEDRVAGRSGPLGAIDYGGMFGAILGDVRWQHNGNGTLVWNTPFRLAQITGGTSQTILVAEDSGRGARTDGQWVNGENIFDQTGSINRTQADEMWSDHPGGVHVLYCDGSAHFLADATDQRTLAALITRDGEAPP
jgi:prepilin-type N-terminal cleavage/methylation domain-containing protein/prepilin-type processing-associated H-X9-DG protein